MASHLAPCHAEDLHRPCGALCARSKVLLPGGEWLNSLGDAGWGGPAFEEIHPRVKRSWRRLACLWRFCAASQKKRSRSSASLFFFSGLRVNAIVHFCTSPTPLPHEWAALEEVCGQFSSPRHLLISRPPLRRRYSWPGAPHRKSETCRMNKSKSARSENDRKAFTPLGVKFTPYISE